MKTKCHLFAIRKRMQQNMPEIEIMEVSELLLGRKVIGTNDEIHYEYERDYLDMALNEKMVRFSRSNDYILFTQNDGENFVTISGNVKRQAGLENCRQIDQSELNNKVTEVERVFMTIKNNRDVSK